MKWLVGHRQDCTLFSCAAAMCFWPYLSCIPPIKAVQLSEILGPLSQLCAWPFQTIHYQQSLTPLFLLFHVSHTTKSLPNMAYLATHSCFRLLSWQQLLFIFSCYLLFCLLLFFKIFFIVNIQYFFRLVSWLPDIRLNARWSCGSCSQLTYLYLSGNFRFKSVQQFSEFSRSPL